jgi:hypothetical protein
MQAVHMPGSQKRREVCLLKKGGPTVNWEAKLRRNIMDLEES